MRVGGGRATRHRAGVLAAAGFLLASACSSPSGPDPRFADSPSPQLSPTSGHDLGLTVVAGEAEVNAPFTLTFTVTNSGPDEALGIVTVKDLIALPGLNVWAPSGGRLVAFDPGAVPGGAEVSRKATLRFIGSALARIEAHVAPDEPPDRDPTDNALTVEVEVTSPECTDRPRTHARARDGRGADVRNRAGRQVVCTGDGDDTITAGDRDVVRSGAGEDRITCEKSFCVLDLGPGDDVAICRGACYVNGGPGKDDCPDGPNVIKENCET